jgi:PAN domain
MLKTGRIGLWCAIVGFALAAQGCRDDAQDRLTLLGEGGCRTADGGEGTPSPIQVASAEACEAQCFAGQAACAAVEYNANNGICEVHREPIARFEHVEGVACYAMR